MISHLLGLAVAALVVFGAVRHRHDRERIRQITPKRVKGPSVGPLHIVGRFVGRAPLLKRYAKGANYESNLGLAFVGGAAAFVVSHTFAVVIVLVILGRPWLASRRQAKLRRRQIERELPMAADLLRLCVASGTNITKAIEHVGTHLDGPIGKELTSIGEDVRRGRRLADAIDSAGARLGDEARALVSALVSSERYGAPLSGVLERMASEARRAQERRAEQAARRLSVQLLFPVAGTILPAFALLTVAPLLASSIGPLASLFH